MIRAPIEVAHVFGACCPQYISVCVRVVVPCVRDGLLYLAFLAYQDWYQGTLFV